MVCHLYMSLVLAFIIHDFSTSSDEKAFGREGERTLGSFGLAPEVSQTATLASASFRP